MARALSRQMSLALITLLVLAAVLAFYSTRGPGGVGGTGIVGPGGVGGTGIFGRIDRFGSIWVNGREIFYDDNLPLTRSGAEAGPEKFAPGQMVAVVAEERDGAWQARSARIIDEVIGPIEIAGEHSMMVLDQQILFTEQTNTAEGLRETIEAGGMVAISGYRTPDGAIIATRIDPVGRHAELFVRGAAFNIAADSFSIGGLNISYEGLAVSEGDVVAARGAMIGAQFTAYDVRKDSAFEGLGLENISYQGVAHTESDGENLRVGEYSAANASIVASSRDTGDYTLVVLEGGARPNSLALDRDVRASAIEEQFLAPAPEWLGGLAEGEAEPNENPEELERREPATNDGVNDAVNDGAREEPARVEQEEDAISETTAAPETSLREEDSAREPEPVEETSDTAATGRPAENPDAPERSEDGAEARPDEFPDAPDRPEVERPERPERPEGVRPERPERPQRPNR